MKKILIYDVAAEFGGAEVVLKEYYDRYFGDSTKDTTIVTSVLDYPENDHLHILKLSWTKKSMLHRLFCDELYMSWLIKKGSFDEVISLQNTGIPRVKVLQTVYLHNAIPFAEHKFSLGESKFLWFYQNVKGWYIKKSLKRADKIIVQTDWMKKAVVEQCRIEDRKINVQKIVIEPKADNHRVESGVIRYFYPAGYALYKNHQCLVEAAKMLVDERLSNFEVILSLDEGSEVFRRCETLFSGVYNPFKFEGYLDKTRMEQYYLSSILVFPSYLETVGLPLLEAKSYSAPIIAADCLYARDTVGEYEKVSWFDYRNPVDLANEMRKMISCE